MELRELQISCRDELVLAHEDTKFRISYRASWHTTHPNLLATDSHGTVPSECPRQRTQSVCVEYMRKSHTETEPLLEGARPRPKKEENNFEDTRYTLTAARLTIDSQLGGEKESEREQEREILICKFRSTKRNNYPTTVRYYRGANGNQKKRK